MSCEPTAADTACGPCVAPPRLLEPRAYRRGVMLCQSMFSADMLAACQISSSCQFVAVHVHRHASFCHMLREGERGGCHCIGWGRTGRAGGSLPMHAGIFFQAPCCGDVSLVLCIMLPRPKTLGAALAWSAHFLNNSMWAMLLCVRCLESKGRGVGQWSSWGEGVMECSRGKRGMCRRKSTCAWRHFA